MADKTKEKPYRNSLGRREFLPAVPPDDQYVLVRRGLVSEEAVVLHRWGSDTRKFGLSTELIM